MLPKVSVVMPAYNLADYIEETIKSVCNQTYPNWELIIVNDGSTDSTEDIIKTIQSGESRIRIYNQTNQGVSVARNCGINLARGEFVTFLDGDDLWEPAFLEKMILKAETSNADVVYSGFKVLKFSGRHKGYSYQYRSGNILLPALERKTWMSINCLMVRMDFLNRFNIRFVEGCAIYEDVEFQLKIFALTDNVHVVPEELMIYRQRYGSATKSPWKFTTYIHSVYALERLSEYINNFYTGQDVAQVRKALGKRLCFAKYRILWGLLKQKDYRKVMDCLAVEGWLSEIVFYRKSLKFLDRLRINIILARNILLWKLVGTIFGR